MPNLEHDPQNPTDLLGNPIAEGDTVAWGTTWGRSPALCVAKIERIRFITKDGKSYGENRECQQFEADDYQLVLRPIKSTGDITWVDKTPDLPRPSGNTYRPSKEDREIEPERYETKTKTVQLVKNVVKL